VTRDGGNRLGSTSLARGMQAEMDRPVGMRGFGVHFVRLKPGDESTVSGAWRGVAWRRIALHFELCTLHFALRSSRFDARM
jgi:hypothetical protein